MHDQLLNSCHCYAAAMQSKTVLQHERPALNQSIRPFPMRTP